MSNNYVTGLPGVKTERSAAYRRITFGGDQTLLAGGKVIAGSVSRDPGNTGNLDVLRAGLLMGKITTGGKYAPSIIGVLGDAYDGAATQMNFLTAAMAAELTRRVGATGTFKITGPPTAAGTVQTSTITYSSVGAGAGGNEVQTFTPDAPASAGTYRIKLSKPDGTFVYTAELAFGATLAACQAAITLALGAVAGWVASSAGSAAPWSGGPIALVLTASGTGYTATDLAMCEIDITSLTGVATMTEVQTTRGIPVAGTVTITAAGAAVNEVQTVTIGGTCSGGTLQLGFRAMGDPTGPIEWTDTIAWSGTEATMTASAQSAMDDLLGANTVVISTIADTAALAMVFTFSGTGAAALTHGLISTNVAALTGASTSATVRTTAGVTASANDFIAGSFIQPTDGSETILTLINDGTGIKVTDSDSENIDVDYAELVTGGQIVFDNIVNAPTDTSLITYVKDALNAAGHYTFEDTF